MRTFIQIIVGGGLLILAAFLGIRHLTKQPEAPRKEIVTLMRTLRVGQHRDVIRQQVQSGKYAHLRWHTVRNKRLCSNAIGVLADELEFTVRIPQ
ncbi:MAG TPA: hypothetical protein VF681_01850 [Abditibacteriaceae bacterium]